MKRNFSADSVKCKCSQKPNIILYDKINYFRKYLRVREVHTKESKERKIRIIKRRIHKICLFSLKIEITRRNSLPPNKLLGFFAAGVSLEPIDPRKLDC